MGTRNKASSMQIKNLIKSSHSKSSIRRSVDQDKKIENISKPKTIMVIEEEEKEMLKSKMFEKKNTKEEAETHNFIDPIENENMDTYEIFNKQGSQNAEEEDILLNFSPTRRVTCDVPRKKPEG